MCKCAVCSTCNCQGPFLSLFIHSVFDLLFLSVLGLIIYIFVYYIKRYMLNYWIKRAVNAAEITHTSPKQGVKKKEMVLSFLDDNDLKYGFSEAIIDLLLESAVYDLNIQQGKFMKTSRTSSVKKVKNLD